MKAITGIRLRKRVIDFGEQGQITNSAHIFMNVRINGALTSTFHAEEVGGSFDICLPYLASNGSSSSHF